MLEDFERDYRRYIEGQIALSEGRSSALPEQALSDLRAQLVRRTSRAGRAMRASGLSLTLTPPPLLGGPVLTAFESQVFAHESPPYGDGPDPFATANTLLDGMSTALGSLEDDLAQARRKEEGKRAPRRAAEATVQHIPTLWGHIRRLPGWLATGADAITVVGAFLGAGRLLGFW